MAERVRRRRSKAKDDARSSAKKAADDAQAERSKPDAGGPSQQWMFREFLNAFGGSASGGFADAISQMLVTSVGSAPSVAVANSMLAANAAEGTMYFNAVAHQQKTNLLGMAMTAKCVRYMLDGRPDVMDPGLDDLVHDLAGEAADEQ